jgi:hypothetical protein
MRQQDEPGTATACGSLGWFPPTYDDGRDADELAIIGAGDEGAGRCRSAWRNFLYLFCHYFRKIIGQIKIFDKCISDAVAHGVKLLPPYRTTLGVPAAVGYTGRGAANGRSVVPIPNAAAHGVRKP